MKSDTFILGKIKYTFIDDYTGDVLALVYVSNRIFDSEGKYIGELKNKNTLLLIILILFLFLLSTILVVTNIQSAGPVYRDLYVKDEDGVILNENWNIFGNTPNNKVIYPGKSGYYKFNLINDNNVEIKFSIEFTDNNINHIPIVYRLYTNNESLLGDDKWYSIEDINLYDIVIKSNSEFPITLEWKWIDDGKHDFEDTIVGNLDNVALIEGIASDPSVETVRAGYQKMLEFEPDWIVAIGGGSPIDAAKAMWIKYEYPETTFEDMCKVFGLPKLRTKAHFCAVSSTSGTATEVTAFSIITDYQKGIKYPIADFEITPDVAIVDPELAETMSMKLVAHTGMAAMTHAIEAYVSIAHCTYSDHLAIHAFRMIKEDLILSYNGDMEKRDAMHDAQCLAGMAFSNALLGIVHSMAHKTGVAFADYGAHIIHSAANAMYLPKVIAFNAKNPEALKRYGEIADYMGLGGKDDEEKVQLLIKQLREMNAALNISQFIKHYGRDSYPTEEGFVSEKVFLERLPEIAKNAIGDACTGSNPRIPTQEEMEKLLKCCYYDTEVDF